MMANYTAEDLDKMAGYEAPEPRQAPTTVAEFETQKEAADFVKDFIKLGASGAGQGYAEEALAGLKTGSLSSPEYLKERGELRGGLEEARKRFGWTAPLIEGGAAELVTSAIPIAKGAKVAKRLLSAAVQGAGEAPEVKDIPKYAGISAGLEGGMELGGKLLKNTLFNDPTSIMSRTIGTKGSDIKIKERFNAGKDLTGPYDIVSRRLGGVAEEDGQRAVLGSIERLDKKGFFKQGNKIFDPAKRAFVRTKDSLSGFLKPQTLDDLYSTASQGITSLTAANDKLLKGKSIPVQKFKWAMDDAIANMTYDPQGFNLEAKSQIANEIADIITSDLKIKKMWNSNTGNISGMDIQTTKRALDDYIGSPAFKKKAEEVGVSDSALMSFRTKFDDILDNLGGNDYKLNNDAMSDLLRVQGIIWDKLGRKSVDTGTRLVDTRGVTEKLLDSTINHPAMSILRSDVSKMTESPVSQFGMGVLKRTPSEGLVKDRGVYPTTEESQPVEEEVPQYNVVPKSFSGVMRNPSSIGFSPREIINYRIPRTTQGILENKDKVLAKLVQNGIPEQMVDTIAQALKGNEEDLSNIAPLLMTQFPTLFERSKYKVFDGKFVDPNDKAKAADDISKREDLNSIQRAKMISNINKTGSVPEGM